MLRGILVFWLLSLLVVVWLLSLLVVVWLLYLLDVHMPVLTRVLRYIVNGMKEMAQNE